MRRLLNLVLNCGTSSEKYRSVIPEAYKTNFNVWKYLYIFFSLTFILLAVDSAVRNGMSFLTTGRLFVVGYFAIMTLLFFFVLKPEKKFPQALIYTTMVIMFLISMWYAMSLEEGNRTVAFGIFLVIFPVFMIDRPLKMAALLGSSATVYLVHLDIFRHKIFHAEMINIFIFAVLGVLISMFCNKLRVEEFLLAKKTERALEEQEKASKKSQSMNEALQKMSTSLIEVVGEIVESRDAESGKHIQRVKGLTYILARQVEKDLPEYGLDDYMVKLITFASSLHDVGKISISDKILLKPGRLTPEEYEEMKKHCEKGCMVLEKMIGRWDDEYLKMSQDICANHHEKWDGRGYPKGLKGDEISIAAQIVSVADIYDALTSKRVYKDAYSSEKAMEMLLGGECGAYSEKMKACIQAVSEKFKEYIENPESLEMDDVSFDVVKESEGYVVGLHDDEHTLEARLRLEEELRVITSLSEKLLYTCYVDVKNNEVYRFKADESLENILSGFGDELKSCEKFDKLLNTIIIADDYQYFRNVVERKRAEEQLDRQGYVSTGFRIRLEDGVHHCRMKMAKDSKESHNIIIGIINVDDEHAREMENMELHAELEATRDRVESRKRMQEELAVMKAVSGEYLYISSRDTESGEVKEYCTTDWLHDMFKDYENMRIDYEARMQAFKGIFHPDDYVRFAEVTRPEAIKEALKTENEVRVSFRAYRFGKLEHFEIKYIKDADHPGAVIIALRRTNQ